jgi:hypothetical protein
MNNQFKQVEGFHFLKQFEGSMVDYRPYLGGVSGADVPIFEFLVSEDERNIILDCNTTEINSIHILKEQILWIEEEYINTTIIIHMLSGMIIIDKQ